MKLIIESGSSKSDWIILNKNGVDSSFQTTGMNPVAGFEENDIIQQLSEKAVLGKLPFIKEVYFYGAGCKQVESKSYIRGFMNSIIKGAMLINIHTDILAVGKAVYGNEKGNIGILGTGSLAAVYDGQSIIESTSSLGYLINDEGSGYEIGKEIIKQLQTGENQCFETIRKKLNLPQPEKLIDILYRQKSPNRIIAGYSRILTYCIENKETKNILRIAFQRYFDYQLKHLTKLIGNEIRFCGSIAYYFGNELKEMAEENGFIIEKILQSPREGLIKYHLTTGH